MTFRVALPLALVLCACSGEDARPPRNPIAKDAGDEQRDANGADQSADSDSGDASARPDGSDAAPSDSASETDTNVHPDAPSTDGGAPDRDAPDGDAGQEPPDSGTVTSCAADVTWAAGQRLAVSTAEDDVFGSISASELTIAWRSEPSGQYHYADRATRVADFGTTKTLPAGYGSFAHDRAGLSPDGLRLVLVTQNRKGFVELRRAALGDSFAAPETGPFAELSQYGANAPAGELFSDPVLASDDRGFVYSLYGAGRVQTVFFTSRLFASDSWHVGRTLLDDPRLSASVSGRIKPTALTEYNSELFYWDEADAVQRFGSIDWTARELSHVTDLGQKQFATPSDGCRALYYSAPGSAGTDLFWAAPL